MCNNDAKRTSWQKEEATIMRFPTLFLFILFPFNSFCQDTFTSIKGTVVDRKSKEFIPYASIYIKGKSIGTTTNDEGRFLFHIPSAYRDETLVISVIGYHSFESTVLQMTDKDNYIKMEQNIFQLKEVTISASKKELTGRDIVKKAAAQIAENYPMTPFQIEGFFRDLQKENGKPVALLEAAIRLHYKTITRDMRMWK